jgi:hypothetical protein
MTDSEFIEWPNRGKANRLWPRGMSDYARITSKRYLTEDGHELEFRLGKWKAHYKGSHTKPFDNYLDAINALEGMNS